MEKILLAINAVNPDKNALEFACYLAELTTSKLTAEFLENFVAEEKPVVKHMYGNPYLDYEVNEKSDEHKAKMKLIEKNISVFKKECISRKVNYGVHKDSGVPATELIEESRFADVLIIDAGTTFNKEFEGTLTKFVRDILKKSECPVIIAPKNFEGIDEIVFTYDGSSSSVFAIKQFTHLFPQFHKNKKSIIQVNESGQWNAKDKYKLNELLKEHYTNLHFEALKGEADSKLFNYLFNKKKIFLVMGAYGRNALSMFFKHSHADRQIKTGLQPIFIAHF